MHLFRLFLFFMMLALPVDRACAGRVLRVLAWPGYADADLAQVFEQRNKVRVEVTIVSTDDALREKLVAEEGGAFDVVAANTAEISRFIDMGLLAPLKPADIPRTREQQPGFRDLAAIPGITRDDKVYAIPFTYFEMGLIYDRRAVQAAPASLRALWDPRYRGRVIAYDGSSHNFTLTALALGLPDPFRLNESEFRQVARQLIDLRRNALAFYRLPEESVELFRHDGGALMFANYGNQQVKQLRDQGADVGYILPEEGVLAWLDCWAVTRKARDRKLAQAWIDYTLEEPVTHGQSPTGCPAEISVFMRPCRVK